MSSVGKDVDSEYKKTLLSRLLAGVKGCQSRFGSRSELATEDDASVARLCVAYEDVFTHGFQNKSAQQSSTSKANFWVMKCRKYLFVGFFKTLINYLFRCRQLSDLPNLPHFGH